MAWGHCPGASAVWPPHQCYSCSKIAEAESPDKKRILAGCKIQTSQKRGPRHKPKSSSICKSQRSCYIWTNPFDTNIPTYYGFQGRVKAQQFHHSMKHSLTHLISEHRSFFLGWGTWPATDTSCLVQTDQPKGLSGHTHTHTTSSMWWDLVQGNQTLCPTSQAYSLKTSPMLTAGVYVSPALLIKCSQCLSTLNSNSSN